MTRFQEILANDLDAVFFNEEEHASEHNIDGRTVSVVVDNDLLTARKIKAGRGGDKVRGEGIFDGDLLFFVPSGRLIKPKVGQIMRFDGYPYRVTDASELDGMLTVTLKGNFK